MDNTASSQVLLRGSGITLNPSPYTPPILEIRRLKPKVRCESQRGGPTVCCAQKYLGNFKGTSRHTRQSPVGLAPLPQIGNSSLHLLPVPSQYG